MHKMDSQNSLLSVSGLNSRLARGSESIFEELDARFRHQLCTLIDRKLNDRFKRRQDPDDIYQSVMKSFYVRVQDGQYYFESYDRLWAMLRTIAQCKLLKRVERDQAAKRDVRRESSTPAEEACLPVELEPDEIPARILGDLLEQVLDELHGPWPEIFRLQLYGYAIEEVLQIILSNLPEPYPRILQLRLQGHSEQEIATRLGCQRGMVRYRLKRIQQRLSQLLSASP